MSYAHRLVSLGLAGVVAIGATVAGCASPWFGNAKHERAQASQPANTAADLKQATITYITGLCKLPKQQHDDLLRELNEALLPNHATISCGPASGT